MADIILACLLIGAGILAAIIALVSAGANAFGGATNPSAVNHSPTVVFAVIALAAIGTGAVMLFG